MVGPKIREVRQSQQRSLADVAGEASISVATLSRIENDKQTLDLALFLVLARVLGTSPTDLLGGEGADNGNGKDPLVRQIVSLDCHDRAQLWRDIAAEQRVARSRNRESRDQQIGPQVDELLAQLECVREELESIRKRVKRRR